MSTILKVEPTDKIAGSILPEKSVPREWAERMLHAALEYAAAGVPVFPVRPRDKHPLVAWGTEPTTDSRKIRQWWTKPEWLGAMVATPTGYRSGLYVLDIDEKAGRSGAATLAARGFVVPEHSPTVRTASGGRHAFFAWSNDLRNTTGDVGSGVDTRGEGGLVILAPSIRKMDGQGYEFETHKSVADFIAAARACPIPDSLLAILPAAKSKADMPSAPIKSADVSSDFGRRSLQAQIRNIANVTENRNIDLYNRAQTVAGLFLGGEVTEDDALDALGELQDASSLDPDEAHKAARNGYATGLRRNPIFAPPSLVERHFEEPAPAAPASVGHNSTNWRALCLQDSQRKPLSVLANVMLALRLDPAVSECLAYDAMRCKELLVEGLPGGELLEAPRLLEDTDTSELQVWLQNAGLAKLGKDVTNQAVELRARERSFHPVRDYLNSLRWDGQARVDGWLSTYMGAERKAYHDGIGRMFLVALVARIMQPGCKADYMAILEGRQGAGKSTACAILGGQWFSDNLPDLREGKDVSQHLAGKWLLEVPEMSAMSKAESAALKAFLSRTHERYRPTFGRREVEQPRQCLFIGTTNASAYLRDETGGRRFWPVKVGKIDLDGLAADRDQLFAEAVHLFNKGVAWWPDAAFEREHIKPEQEARFEDDAWESSIITWLADQTEPVLLGDIGKLALQIDRPRLGRMEQNRITAILERLGYEQLKKDRHGYRRWDKIRLSG